MSLNPSLARAFIDVLRVRAFFSPPPGPFVVVTLLYRGGALRRLTALSIYLPRVYSRCHCCGIPPDRLQIFLTPWRLDSQPQRHRKPPLSLPPSDLSFSTFIIFALASFVFTNHLLLADITHRDPPFWYELHKLWRGSCDTESSECVMIILWWTIYLMPSCSDTGRSINIRTCDGKFPTRFQTASSIFYSVRFRVQHLNIRLNFKTINE